MLRYDAFQPLRLPDTVWSSQETRSALRDRRIDRLFLLAKKHAGASQARIATATGLNQGEVSRIQRGGRRVTAIDLLERIADGFAMPDTARMALGLAPTDWSNAAIPGPRGDRLVPAQLPPVVSAFTGRCAELGWLREHAAAGSVLVAGPSGIGKTALALKWAHTAAGDFPDGQLYVDLRGTSADPVDPAVALTGLLRALDTVDTCIPPTLEERTARYRSLLAGKRVLVLVDDAASAAQVRPLLPGSADSLLVATSRNRLEELVIHEGTAALRLAALPTDEAVELLARIAGRSRVESEPAAAAQLVELCGRNPLALRIAAVRLADRPRQQVSAMVGSALHRVA